MKKLLSLLFLSLGLIGISYADVRHCSNEVTKSLGVERCYSKHEHESTTTTYYENGQKETEITVSAGTLLLFTQFFESGQKDFEVYVKSEGKNDKSKDERWTFWYEDGQMKSESILKRNNHKKETSWDENGLITSESNWKDGVCISGDCPE